SSRMSDMRQAPSQRWPQGFFALALLWDFGPGVGGASLGLAGAAGCSWWTAFSSGCFSSFLRELARSSRASRMDSGMAASLLNASFHALAWSNCGSGAERDSERSGAAFASACGSDGEPPSGDADAGFWVSSDIVAPCWGWVGGK